MNATIGYTDLASFQAWVVNLNRGLPMLDRAMESTLLWTPQDVYGPERRSLDGWRSWFQGLPVHHPAVVHLRHVFATEWEKR